MVDLLGVLSLGELAIEERVVGVGLVVEDLDALAAARLLQGGLGHAVEHAHLVLFYRHRHRDAELVDQHLDERIKFRTEEQGKWKTKTSPSEV